MGAGVYSSNFSGTGTTIIVSPSSYLTQDEYSEYVKGSKEDGFDPLDYEEWCRDVRDCEAEDLVHTLREALSDVADPFRVVSQRNGGTRFVADRDFLTILDNDRFSFAIREWESDTILAIGPSSASLHSLLTEGEEYDGHSLEVHALSLDDLGERHANQLSALEDIAIQVLLANGIECRYPTSSWTTKPYTKADDPSAITGLKALLDEPSPSVSPGP